MTVAALLAAACGGDSTPTPESAAATAAVESPAASSAQPSPDSDGPGDTSTTAATLDEWIAESRQELADTTAEAPEGDAPDEGSGADQTQDAAASGAAAPQTDTAPAQDVPGPEFESHEDPVVEEREPQEGSEPVVEVPGPHEDPGQVVEEPGPQEGSEPVVEEPTEEGGDIVCSRGGDGIVACPRDIPEDYWCENVGDVVVCHNPDTTPRPEPERGRAVVVWAPPEAGMVPETAPLCPEDRGTWTRNCMPPREWQRGDRSFNPAAGPTSCRGRRRRSWKWYRWCRLRFGGSCLSLLGTMHQALDYLGAREQCVLDIYTRRVD